MGLRLIAWVHDAAPLDGLKPIPHIALLALAEWARDDTGECWPGRDALARRLRRGIRTADRAVADLVAAGLVEIVSTAAPGSSVHYRIVRHAVSHERATCGDDRSTSNVRHPGQNVRHRMSHERATPDVAQNRQLSRQEPSRERAARAQAIPDDWKPNDGHRVKATRLGLDVDADAEGFRDHALSEGRQSADWHAAFRRWLDESARRKSVASRSRRGATDTDAGWDALK